MANEAKLMIIRGLPGSGKSAMAGRLLEQEHVDVCYKVNDYFMREDKYEWDCTKVMDAHHHCQHQVLESLLEGKRVAVVHPFMKLHEMEGYIKQLYLVTPPDETGFRSLSVSIAKCVEAPEEGVERALKLPQALLRQMEDDYERFSDDDMTFMVKRMDEEVAKHAH